MNGLLLLQGIITAPLVFTLAQLKQENQLEAGEFEEMLLRKFEGQGDINRAI